MSNRSNATSARSMRARVLLLASVAALVVTSFEAHAAPAVARSTATSSELAAAPDSTEYGARRRARRGNAAGLAMMGMMVGTIGAVIAAQQRREAYEASYNRAHAYYGYPYAHHPRPHAYHRPHVYHGHHGYRTYDGQPPTPPLINGHRVGW